MADNDDTSPTPPDTVPARRHETNDFLIIGVVLIVVAAFCAHLYSTISHETNVETTTVAADCTDLNGERMANAEAIIKDGRALGYAFNLNGSRVEIFAPDAGSDMAGPLHEGFAAFHLYRCSLENRPAQ